MKINIIMHRCDEYFNDEVGMIPRSEAVMAIYQHEGETDKSFSVRSNNIVTRLSSITHRERMEELDIVPPSWAGPSLDKKLYDNGYLYIEGVEVIEK